MPWPRLSYGSDVTALVPHPRWNPTGIMFFCWSGSRTRREWMNLYCWTCSSAPCVSSGWTPRRKSSPVSTPSVAAVSKASSARAGSCAARSAARWWSVPWTNSPATSSSCASWMASSNDLERLDLERESARTVLLEPWPDRTTVDPETKAPPEHSPREPRQRAPSSGWVHVDLCFLLLQQMGAICALKAACCITDYNLCLRLTVIVTNGCDWVQFALKPTNIPLSAEFFPLVNILCALAYFPTEPSAKVSLALEILAAVLLGNVREKFTGVLV